MIRIVLADDHRIVTDGLAQILSYQEDMEIAAVVEDGDRLCALLQTGIEIDVLVLDMSMPGRTGLDLIKHLNRHWPKLPILVLSMHPEAVYGMRALKLGANGYLTKDSDASQLVRAVRQVAAGRSYASEALISQLVDSARGAPNSDIQALSDRELLVLQLLASGSSVTDIAERLCLSVKTVSTHKANIQRKLGVVGTAHLVKYALSYGI
ncbi:response regulator [Paracoccus aminophilus]|uniref:Transcriptional regulator, LuxR family n=1 Tax=Paracoccus aminophilus JCM 7686 TaxID=1367847 RepID=S5Z124_PARAH|nr:response regulator transcription factor [Paracoccus aminophilus]AGT11126.1 transcriptional regulator, LuxR family [Paracoccus aminophilus JCM 7686]